MSATSGEMTPTQVTDNSTLGGGDVNPVVLSGASVTSRATSKITPFATVTLISSPNPIKKKYRFDAAGELIKEKPKPLGSGGIERKRIASAQGFATLLQRLSHSETLMYGVFPQNARWLTSTDKLEKAGIAAGTYPRTKDYVTWPECLSGGVLMLDYDPPKGGKELTREELLDAIRKVLPELDGCSYVWWVSSSSYIYNGDTELQGLRGQRVYILVRNAQDIKRAGEILFDRLWLAGYGHYEISAAGTALPRSVIDAAVWQPTRLDYASKAKCDHPLTQRRGEPLVYEGQFLDTVNVIKPLTTEETEELKRIRKQALEKVKPELEAAKEKWKANRVEKLVAAHKGEVTETLRTQFEKAASSALESQTLLGDFIITMADGREVTVAEILENPKDYHKQETLDPLEPEYDGSKQTGILYLIDQQPVLYSRAHGGRTFKLRQRVRHVEHKSGATNETVESTLAILREAPDFFDMGSSLVLMGADGMCMLNEYHRLAHYLGREIQYRGWDSRGKEKDLDPPDAVVKRLLAIGSGGRRLKRIKAVLSAPVILEDGRLINRPGYDEVSELYLAMFGDVLSVPDIVDERMAAEALAVLMEKEAFGGFCVATPADRGVLLAMILTAIQRYALPTAPALGSDAPARGTGKTYLARCIALLCTGKEPAISPTLNGANADDEMRKRITTAVLEGQQVILQDNVTGRFDSPSLAGFLTSGVWNDRVLSKSESVTAETRILFLITGNNLDMAGDMPRRVLTCRIDAGEENPHTRKFDRPADSYIKENRLKLVCAGLTLIRGYMQSEHYRTGGAALDSTASFEVWDKLCRQPVCWVAQTFGKGDYDDPGKKLAAAVASDPEREQLGELLELLAVCMGDDWFSVGQLMAALLTAKGGELRQIFIDIVRNPNPNKHSVGMVLKYRKDQIVRGLKLEVLENPKKGNQYRVVRAAD